MPYTYIQWERFLSRRVFVDIPDTLNMGQFCTYLREMWEDAQAHAREQAACDVNPS